MSESPRQCLKCRKGTVALVIVPYSADMEHDGRIYRVTIQNLEVLRCNHCHAQVLPDQSYAKLTEALRVHARLLTPAQIAAKRQALGLSQSDFAQLLDVPEATVSRWETGGQMQMRAMNDLMEAFFDLQELRDYLKRKRVLSSTPSSEVSVQDAVSVAPV